MFLKSYKLKSNAPLKGSDSKRLRQRLEKAFPALTAEQAQILLPAKANVSMLKLVLHSEQQTNVFCVDKLPMFFENSDSNVVPTLYALWLVPDLLPYYTTFPAVLPKLSGGADLMLPGVVTHGTGMNMYGRYQKDQLMAINLTSTRAAVAVGMLTRSTDDLYMCGGRGSAVKILHIFGDKLWSHEPGLTQQVPNLKRADLTADDFPALGALDKRSQKADLPPPTLAEVLTREANVTPADNVEILADLSLSATIKDSTQEKDEDETQESTVEQMLRNAFLAALKNHGKSLQLPLLTSNFYRLYVVPEASQSIDLKKTKYKKLSNFLNEMIDQGFLVVREETKGVDKITSIDLSHPEVVNFITDHKPAHPPATGGGGETNGTPEQPLFHSELTEMYVVSDATAAFFTKMNFKRGEGIPVGQIKKIVREYISKQSLPVADPAEKTIRLDDTLRQVCELETATSSRICNTLVAKMEHTYQMSTLKDVATTNKPLIQMSLATRSGNKKVTLVSNVECYGIIVPEFIKLCKQGAAASTTVVKLPHQKREQLQIQGNQVRFIHNLLTGTYKVPAKCILGLELAKDGKKHKK